LRVGVQKPIIASGHPGCPNGSFYAFPSLHAQLLHSASVSKTLHLLSTSLFPCPIGYYNFTNRCAPCPPGFYSGIKGALACTPCPAATPYSLPGSTLATACVSCAAGCSGGYGASTCPYAYSDWLLWLDATGLEGTHSCVRYVSSVVNFVQANTTCSNMGAGVHLLTSRQVTYVDVSW
jgi:hypothetical protein